MSEARENAFFFQAQGQRLFGVLHLPAPRADHTGTGWVFCSAFGEERGFSQRFMVEWARVVCREGHWVLRFDYRGTCDSGGRFEEYTAEDYLADIEVAVRELKVRSGVSHVGLCGLRLGATLGALAAQRLGGRVPLIMIEPVVRGCGYLGKVLRDALAAQVARIGSRPRSRLGSRQEIEEEIARGGEVIIFGRALSKGMWDSIASIDLLASPPAGRGPALVVLVNKRRRRKPRPELAALRDALTERGPIELVLVQTSRPWREHREYDVRPAGLFEKMKQWLLAHSECAASGSETCPGVVGGGRCPHTGTATLVAPQCSSDTRGRLTIVSRPHRGPGERVVQFEREGARLWGILHVPEAYRADRPAVLFISPGFNSRTARYALYVRMARELASAGWASLRFDPRGIGDSEGELSYGSVAELHLAIERGLFVPDTSAAVRFVGEALGNPSAILTGLCGGATTAVLTAAEDQRVVGVAALELPLVYTRQPGEWAPSQRNPLSLAQAGDALCRYWRRPSTGWGWQRLLSLRSNFRAIVRSLFAAAAKRLTPIGSNGMSEFLLGRLGPRAHFDLIAAMQRCLVRQMPVLLAYGETLSQRYCSAVRRGLKRQAKPAWRLVQEHVVAGADRGFSVPVHAEELCRVVAGWLTAPERPWATGHPADTTPAQRE